MAFSDNQTDPKLPLTNDNDREASDFLPKYFRTDVNQKFLKGTIDQLISVGDIDKLNAYIGRKNTVAYVPTDNYIEDISSDRESYQLEPSVVVRDDLDNVTFFKDYNDYINQIKFFNDDVQDHSKLNSQEFYAWDPHINFDKFINYREYYWLPTGPQAVPIAGQSKDITSTYQITLANETDNYAYVFTPNGLTRNPTIKLYRGQTYNFVVDCEGQPITFKKERTTADTDIYKDGITSPSDFVEQGTITFTVPENAPDVLYYVSKNDVNTSGFFKIYNIEENTEINVDLEILGKKNYKSSNSLELSNGMKVYFLGNVTPAKYATGEWYVEGVGDSITLVSEKDLSNPADYSLNLEIQFDDELFDTQGFDVNNGYARAKDYIVSNRASKDLNPWCRYNRWFHKDVIVAAAETNNQPVVLDQSSRATRPIIEFKPNIQLWNFGSIAKQAIDLIDVYTKDAFSKVEGSLGYKVDGISLLPGMRVLFAADTDKIVNGRIFEVQLVTHLNERRITLLEVADTLPLTGESVLVLNGDLYRGKTFHYDGTSWVESQSKDGINFAPLFDVFDISGTSFGDKTNYIGSRFRGTKLLSYSEGDSYDSELGFNISYRSIGNVGDILFDFNLQKDTFTYQESTNLITTSLDRGYLKINESLTDQRFENGWVKAVAKSNQPVVRQYNSTQFLTNFFAIDVYQNSGDLNDLEVEVFVNGDKQIIDVDYEIYRQNSIAYIQFENDLTSGSSVIIESISNTPKLRDKGFYKFPSNLESNPLNLSLDNLTLGEASNHVRSIANNINEFSGKVPGSSNLRDLGKIEKYGNRIIQHSGPLAPIIYHFTDKNVNIIKSLRYAGSEYAKFKRNFVRIATELGFDGEVKDHFDKVMFEIAKDKTTDSPFYLSDMVHFGVGFTYQQTVIDDSFTDYPLTFNFDLNTLSNNAVFVYLNDEMLLARRDYTFVNESFIRILKPIVTGDDLKIVQYSNVAGCCVPPTPTKLGLYPLYEPSIFVDDTYQTPTKVIQGHDGSITVAYNDYRDDLLLELEKRIYNNIKISYDSSLFDINNFIGGYYRTGEVTTKELNDSLRKEFLLWFTLVNQDYTDHNFYDTTNPFTFNYKSFSNPNGENLSGFWRSIYKDFYDTDRPHTHPWEMLGFSIKPTWWDEQYGPAPYTRDNLLLWRDLKDGIAREPNTLQATNKKYARPTLLDHIPVDAEGNLLHPLQTNIVKDFVQAAAFNVFGFGDQAPVETAWRRSGQYPFALLTSLLMLRPAQLFAVCFDRSRQVRDESGQIIYKLNDSNVRFNLKDLIFPSTPQDNIIVYTSGLVNYLADYAISKSFETYDLYKENLNRLEVKLSSKLAGFTTKDKLKLILDSRSPLNQSSVFLPQENYEIILNTSSPVLSISYSGIIVEKLTNGFKISGYNKSIPEFKYFKTLETASDPVVNVGGISETYVTWASGKYYGKGQLIRNGSFYYRVVAAHTSDATFEDKFYARLPALPIVGGRNIIIRRRFETEISTIHYGAVLNTVQDVVDFILGYGEYLKNQGFEFNYFNEKIETVINWQTSAREFAFWTTQNWSAGAVIALSPAAQEVLFEKDYAVSDNIYDSFYDYSIFKQDGLVLEPSFTNAIRKGNKFGILPTNDTADGIYHATLNLVQKEHVLILDDLTVFGDVIFDPVQGYRQERIKVVGYKISNWNGDFNIPGFMYDRATITIWEAWRDYSLGETVKYKEFYYSAKKNVPGSAKFNDEEWYRLSSKPTSRLLPNWDYRATQFEDFYDLDTDNFDSNQQAFAQHLIGYQKRQYLENIINDDVSQYKFYQGMIQEKGTTNSLSKLFDALSASGEDSLEFYEEWAIRLGQYGASGGFEEIEYILDEEKFLINPQPIELVNELPSDLNDFVYRITKDEVYLQPDDYDHAPIPTTLIDKEFVPTAGYVNLDDVDFTVKTKEDFTTIPLNELTEGDYVWVGVDGLSWNVYRYTFFASSVREFVDGDNLKIVLPSNRTIGLEINDYVVIQNVDDVILGMHKIVGTGVNFIEIEKPAALNPSAIDSLNENLAVAMFKFTLQRISNIDDLNTLPLDRKKDGELVWSDNEGNWNVWKFEKVYNDTFTSNEENLFSKTIAVSDTETYFAASGTNLVFYYSRPTPKFPWRYQDQISPLTTVSFSATNGTFGQAICFSSNGDCMLIGAPGYSNNQGYVARYNKNQYGTFVFDRVIQQATPVNDSFFGYKIESRGNFVYIVAKGDIDAAVPSSVSVYNLVTNTIVDEFILSEVDETITDISVSSNNTVIVGTTNEEVYVYTLNTLTNTLVYSQTLTVSNISSIETITEPTNKFGNSVSLTRDGNTLAVGLPWYSGANSVQGAIAIFNLESNLFVVNDFIKSPTQEDSEQFGYRVRFNIDGTKLVVYSLGGDQTFDTVILPEGTIFDGDATRFIERQKDVGSVKVYEKYNTKFLFADELEPSSPDNVTPVSILGTNYGNSVAVVNSIYVNDYAINNGRFYEFASTKRSWERFRTFQPIVRLDKIKSVFLYDTVKNVIIERLDFIDPIHGKILGIADQELAFKTYYDPATYSVGNDSVVVDSLIPWKGHQVGKLWWDLSTIKFVNPNQNTILYKANTWNNVFEGTSVDIYEWVESEYSPEEWDSLADTEAGLTLGISGTTKYGANVYSVAQTYDSVSQTFKNIYYFWVKNKTVVPDVDFRKISARDVADFISDPKSKGYSYITILGKNQFALVNCKKFITDKDVAINIRYWTIENTQINVHDHYQLLAEGNIDNKLNKYVEQKWFDSLIGYDVRGREVPDPALPAKLKYGILSKPRQGMFVNRIEALKQCIERVNSVLIDNLIIDDFDISTLFLRDPEPTEFSGKYDVVINTASQLRFVGSEGSIQAAAVATIIEGKISKVTVTTTGRGYIIPPEIQIISATGTGAKLRAVLNDTGGIASIVVENSGRNYNSGITLSIRPFTVLVLSDETAANKWTMYTWQSTSLSWFRSKTQVFDVTKHWEYVDWYASGYSKFTRINHQIDLSYEMSFIDIQIGDIVKINNEKTGGWLLLEKIDNQVTDNVSINYKTVGRENGTIQFNKNIYDFRNSNIGFDSFSFDGDAYDDEPTEELKYILDCIKNNILIDNLEIEYNKLFFASLRYVFTEQSFVDWAFKTSFVKATHKLGELKQKITYKSDNLESYEDYINEVKPYRSKVREFVSNYTSLEQTNTAAIDFDLPARYSINDGKILPFKVDVSNGAIRYYSGDILNQPYVNWLDNVGYPIIEIKIVDGGSGYQVAPEVRIEGKSTVTATAKAFVTQGKVTKIVVLTQGAGYIETPTITFNGASTNPAVAVPILGSSVVRSNYIKMKFDRLSPIYTLDQITVTQQFVGTGNQTRFYLTWPVDIRTNQTTITIDNVELLSSEFTVYNSEDTASEYTRYKGILDLDVAAPVGSAIVITYTKDIKLLDAADRIQYYYNPEPGQIGKDLGQLMDGVDYGGVEVTGLSFDLGSGWDGLPWFTTGWDDFDETYTDHLVISDGVTREFTLPYVPAVGEEINTYLNGVRLDPADVDTFIGDGVNAGPIEIPVPVVLNNGDAIIFRKNTSDGSFKPTSEFFDSEILGGDFSYNTATGLNAEEITIDGDGFVTITSSHAPEEVVGGQIVDSVDITVYNNVTDGSAIILTRNYVSDGLQTNFDIGQKPNSTKAVFVKINGLIKEQGVDYDVNFSTQTIEFINVPTASSQIVITSMSKNGAGILDTDSFVGDGTTTDFVTIARWNGEYTVDVTVNGDSATVTSFITDETYNEVGNIGIRFETAPAAGDIIDFIVLNSTVNSISRVSTEVIVHDGTNNTYTLSNIARNVEPLTNNAVVIHNGHILKSVDTFYFNVSGTLRTYEISPADYPYNTVDTPSIRVYLNGVPLKVAEEFSWVSSNNQLKVKRGVANAGDLLAMVIVRDNAYLIENSGSTQTITFTGTYSLGDEFIVTTFSNHDILEIQRSNDFITVASTVTSGTVDYFKLNQFLSGRLSLSKPVISSEYVWIIFNGELLTPELDYSLEPSLRHIQIDRKRIFTSSDAVEVIVFNSNTIKEPFAYKIQKDMLNRTFYKRIDDSVSTVLAKDLRYYDTSIEVEDASGLTLPLRTQNQPGVVLINGERIEYLEKTGNVLSYLRRGTLGTGTPEVHPTGTLVRDQSNSQTIPYKDEFETVVLIADGFNSSSQYYENSNGVTVSSITYDSNNNTPYPLGGQTVTVIGSGFRSNVRVFVGDPTATVDGITFTNECVTTYISATELTFISPPNTVGSYDLTILNPATTVGGTPVPQTSLVVPSALNYIQILLPFSPLPRDNSTWYRDTIPAEYREAIDIEVFVAGKRLRKTPIRVWDPTVGPDSPSGDVDHEAEFAVNSTISQYVRLTTAPAKGSKIIIQKKMGQMWTAAGESLADSTSDQAKFIRAKRANLPGWYNK